MSLCKQYHVISSLFLIICNNNNFLICLVKVMVVQCTGKSTLLQFTIHITGGYLNSSCHLYHQYVYTHICIRCVLLFMYIPSFHYTILSIHSSYIDIDIFSPSTASISVVLMRQQLRACAYVCVVFSLHIIHQVVAIAIA